MRELSNKEKSIIQYGFLLFLISITTYLVSTTLDIKLIPRIIKLVNIKYILLGFLFILIYMMLEAIIIHIVINAVEKTKVKFIGLKIGMIGLYYNLVTPFASGSQPIQVYALTKYGIGFSKAVAIVTNKTVIFQSVVTIYCGYIISMNMELLKSEMPSIMILLISGMIMNISMLLGGLLIVFSPKKIKLIVNYLINRAVRFKIFKFLEMKKDNINNYIDEYNNSIKSFIKDVKSLILSLLLTMVQLSIFFSIAYCVYKSFNLNGASYWTMMTLQVFLYMAISPIPTPGNVGANELAFLTIFKNIFPEELIGYGVFLYSGFVYYLIVIIAGMITIFTHYSVGKLKKQKI